MGPTLFFSNEKKNWTQSLNRTLVFLFIATYFLNDITRYKHLLVILMTITSLVYVCKQPRDYIPLFKNFIFASIALLIVAVFISLLHTPDLKASLKEINRSIVENVLICTLTIPVLLKNESKQFICRLVFLSFLTSLSLRCLSELFYYYQDYRKGIMPFSDYSHRGISDSMVFLFPALLNLWFLRETKYRIAFIVMSAIYLFLILGTLSRGAWLSVLLVSFAWALLYKQWKLMLAGIIIGAIAFTAIISHKDMSANLTTKLQQTDSSYRYTNGTQGSAFDLILENPLKGYGFGNEAYKDVYNKRVVDYPNWTFRESIGPHNLALFVWFGTGLLGLASLLLVYAAMIKECVSNAFKGEYASPYNAWMIILLSLIGYFIIRGNVEQIELDLLGIYAGFLIAMRNKQS